MTPYASGPGWELLHGDCIEAMRGMAEASVDAIVCDPPAGIGFMGRGWDGNRGGRDQWIDWLAEVMSEGIRVLKPGAHALVWALPRTSHWTGMALEDAGFDVRDRITHLFGSGFPKSLDVSKAIDRAAGAEREVVGRKADPRYLSPATETSGAPLGCIDPRPNSVENYERAGFVTAPATPEAAAWTGWGTALKPGGEDWWLCRKPLAEGTVAANVMAWGTGGINVDGCRIGTDERTYGMSGAPGGNGVRLHGGDGRDAENARRYACESKSKPPVTVAGRWPANVCLDEEAAALLDEQAGVRTSGTRNGHYPRTNGAHEYGFAHSDIPCPGSTGGASRFYYCSKASRSERNAGLEGMPQRIAPVHNIDGRDQDNPRNFHGAYSQAKGFDPEYRPAPKANHHPTVKPIALMRWLCRLITPPGGLILDPFTGSGSTGLAAIAEGFRFIGIEQSAEYCQIIEARLTAAFPQKKAA